MDPDQITNKISFSIFVKFKHSVRFMPAEVYQHFFWIYPETAHCRQEEPSVQVSVRQNASAPRHHPPPCSMVDLSRFGISDICL